MFYSKKLKNLKILNTVFFQEKDGFSKGIYKVLNCGEVQMIKKKYFKKLNYVQINGIKKKFNLMNQTHSNKVLVIK